MSITLKNVGTPASPTYLIHGRKALVATTGDKSVAVVMDPNDATATAGFGDQTGVAKMYVYTSTDRITWTLVQTNTLANTLHKDATYDAVYACSSGASNQIFVVYRTTSHALRFLILNSSTYAVSTDEQIVAAATNYQYVALDITSTQCNTSGAEAVMVAAQYSRPGQAGDRIGHRVFLRRGTDGTWSQIHSQIDETTNNIALANTFSMIACTWLPNDPINSDTIKFVVLWSRVTTSADMGWSGYIRSIDAYAGTGLSGSTTIALNQDSGSITTLSGLSDQKRRTLDLFCDGDETFIIAMCQWSNGTSGKIYASKYRYTGSSWVASAQALLISGILLPYYFSFGHDLDGNTVIVGHYTGLFDSTSSVIKSRIIKAVGNSMGTFSAEYAFDNKANSNADFISFPHRQPNPNSSTWLQHHNHEGLFIYTAANERYWMLEPIKTFAATPAAVRPAAGSTVTTSEPILQLDGDLDRKWPQTRHKARFQVDVSTGWATDLRDILQDDSQLASILNTDQAGVVVTFSEAVPAVEDLQQGNWYMRGRLVDELGAEGPWLAIGSQFTVSHPPSATPTFPTGGVTLQYGTGEVTFDWNFSDAYVNDSQTAFQVIVEKVSDGSSVLDSGKITSTVTAWTGTIPSGDKDIPLRWKVRTYDEDDVVGAYSATEQFVVADPPTVVINSPVGGGTPVATPNVIAQFTPTMGGGRTAVKFRVSVTQGSTPVFDSGEISQTGTASGVAINYNSGVAVYDNSSDYTMTVQVWDNTGLSGTVSKAFTTLWTPPLDAENIAVTSIHFNVENEGYVLLTWDRAASPDADFVNWAVYRSLDEIDEAGAVIETGTFAKVHEDFDTALNHEYKDYYAPTSKRVNYQVRQVVSRFGDLIESEDNLTVYTVPSADGYWFVEPLNPEANAGAFRLSIVTGDSYTDEYEEAEFTLIGRGRYVDRGDRLGLKGQLEAQLRNTGGSTARQKKRRLELLKEENRNLYLRTPFGDVYRVSVGNVGVGRIAGVGTSEFVNVTIPYSEVS